MLGQKPNVGIFKKEEGSYCLIVTLKLSRFKDFSLAPLKTTSRPRVAPSSGAKGMTPNSRGGMLPDP